MHSGKPPLHDVGWTSLLTAAARAEESRRSAPLVIDPHAERIVDIHSRLALARLGGDAMVAAVVVRTRWFDQRTSELLDAGFEIFVTLGAGFDARHLRLESSARTSWVSVDLQEIAESRCELLPAHDREATVVGDVTSARTFFSVRDALAALHAQPSAKRVWIIEGLLAYLTPKRAATLFSLIHEHSPPGSVVLFDVPNEALARQTRLRARMGSLDVDAPIQFHTDQPRTLLSSHGFVASQLSYVGHVDAHYDRLPALPRSEPSPVGPATHLVEACIGARTRRSASVMEPRAWFYDSDHAADLTGPAVDRYLELARQLGRRARVLELGCGTGRLALPLARLGHGVTAVDNSEAMLRELRAKRAREEDVVARGVRILRCDLRALRLRFHRYDLAILAFNTLLMIDDASAQRELMRTVARHLRPGGRVAVEIADAALVPRQGALVGRVSGIRRDRRGIRYAHFLSSTPLDGDGRLLVKGWYEHGAERKARYPYEFPLRIVSREELGYMLTGAGLDVTMSNVPSLSDGPPSILAIGTKPRG